MTDPTAPSVPAGWYPDSADAALLRYWDGAAWTPHTAPAAAPQPATAAAVAAPPTGPPAPPGAQAWGGPGGPGAPQGLPRNGLGVAALILGIIGILFGFIPFTFFVAGTLGLIGFILGIIGWRRTKRGQATNGKMAIAGVITSVIAMGLAIAGIVILVSATSDVIEALDGIEGKPGVSASCTGVTYPDQQTTDVCADAAATVVLDGVSVTATPLKAGADDLDVKSLCSTVTIKNTSTGSKDYNVFDFKLQTPAGVVDTGSVSNFSGTLNSGTLVAGGTTTGDICSDDTGERGTYVLIYKPNAFESARGIWLQPVA